MDKPKNGKHKKSNKVKGDVDTKPEICLDRNVKHDKRPDNEAGDQSEDKGSETSENRDLPRKLPYNSF